MSESKISIRQLKTLSSYQQTKRKKNNQRQQQRKKTMNKIAAIIDKRYRFEWKFYIHSTERLTVREYFFLFKAVAKRQHYPV